MLASGCSRSIGAGWPGAIRRGLNVVYSSASDVKSFRVCFRYGIALAECIVDEFNLIESLNTDVLKPRTSTGSRNFSSLTRITPFLLKMLSCKC